MKVASFRKLLIVAILTLLRVNCDFNFRAILRKGADKIAEDAGTRVNPFEFDGGLCCSREDFIPLRRGLGSALCRDQSAGKTTRILLESC